jgi:hypothetical protein
MLPKIGKAKLLGIGIIFLGVKMMPTNIKDILLTKYLHDDIKKFGSKIKSA